MSSAGEIVRGRCASPNLCSYCARLRAVENAEVLGLDAVLGRAPTVYAVLTTRSTVGEASAYYDARRQVAKALRRRLTEPATASLLEFTTGRAGSSGGARRPHDNVLTKALDPPERIEEAWREVIERVWCERVDAAPAAQFVGRVYDAGGVMRYLALHFLKEDQRPPEGWKGSRCRFSRGYLWTDTPAARQIARESLRRKRDLWRLMEAEYQGDVVDELDRRAAVRAATSWSVQPSPIFLSPPVGVEFGPWREGEVPPARVGSPARAAVTA